MPLHVYMFEYYGERGGRGRTVIFRNIPGDLLQPRIVDRWDRGENLTWDGRTADSTRSTITVVETATPVADDADWSMITALGTDRTNDWITGPAGARAGGPREQSNHEVE